MNGSDTHAMAAMTLALAGFPSSSRAYSQAVISYLIVTSRLASTHHSVGANDFITKFPHGFLEFAMGLTYKSTSVDA